MGRHVMEGKILAAVSEPEIAESVGLYSIMLAKRTGMEACLLMVRRSGEGQEDTGDRSEDGLYKKAMMLRETGEEEGVKVEFLITEGVFEDVVADQLRERGSSVLVVGADWDDKTRREKFRRIEKGLHEGGGNGGQPLQFLMVSRKVPENAAKEARDVNRPAGKKRKGGMI